MFVIRDIDEIRRDVKQAMAEKNISARHIMRETGISHVTVGKFLKGQGETLDQTVIKLCLYLELNWNKPTATNGETGRIAP